MGISDGDTFTVLTDELQQVKVRLAEIDAPERGQPFGRRSHEALSKMIFHQEVRIEIQTTDRYGRLVGRPFVGKSDVCAEMVGIGAAWVYRKYLLDQNLLEIEDDARSAKRGLWGLPESDAVPPWEWRRIGDQAAGPNGCEIKGNIGNRGDKIYHMPGSRAYGGTKIDQERGERWFCSEQEAQAAGWRVIRR